MQRMKGQATSVSNGHKDIMKDELEPWRSHQTYNSPLSSSSLPDPYMPSYYASMSYSFVNQGLNEGAWSNGSDPMTFLNSYGGQISSNEQPHYIDGIFGQNSFNSYNQSFNYFPGGNGDYSAWSNPALGARKSSHGTYQEDYYRDIYEQNVDQNVLKHVEQGIGGLSITDPKSDSFLKDNYNKPAVLHSNLLTESHLGKKSTPGVIEPVASGSSDAAGQLVTPKKMSWATVVSQPAKPQVKVKSKHVQLVAVHSGDSKNASGMDIGTWENKNGAASDNMATGIKIGVTPTIQTRSSPSWNSPRGNRSNGQSYNLPSQHQPCMNPLPNALSGENYPQHPILDKLRMENDYNPKDFDLNPKNIKFFIIKSYSEDDIHRSIKYSIWCSTEHGNKRLDQAFRESKGLVYLFFSVNGSGHFCGIAQMASPVDYNCTASVWAQDKWKGQFKVKWIYVKDVPNSQLRHIRLENNEHKPVTNSRDTQEVPPEKGKQVLKIIHNFRHTTSIFDDFLHYEKRQEEDEQRKTE